MPFLRGKEIARQLDAVKDEVEELENEYLQSNFMEAIKALKEMNSHLDSFELALAK